MLISKTLNNNLIKLKIMKKHLIALFAGMLSIWLLTAFMNVELNPFNLSKNSREGMIGALVFTQFFIQLGILAFNTNDKD